MLSVVVIILLVMSIIIIITIDIILFFCPTLLKITFLHALLTAMGIQELKADGKTFMAVAASFVKHLADPAPLKTANIQAPRSLTF